jgi:UDP-2,3-diacylglucosamine pyrophosphatase LpxH
MSLPSVDSYDDLYVISDLHMGGPPGFQIFKQGRRLASLVRQLARANPERETGLVINGDVIDSLAEGIDGYIAVNEAEAMIERIAQDPAFRPVWEALAEFVGTPRRRLVLTLGNHDIELALPHVELAVRRRLAADAAAGGRIVFATRGAGYACTVGKARVFCTHGNEVDGWNVVDHEALRKLAAALNAGQPFDRRAWTPNAGTRFVIDVMNQIKRRHPFIDLLKPETNTVFGVLLTIDPGAVRAAKNGLPVITDRIRGEVMARGLLSADIAELDREPPAAAARRAMDQLLGANLRAAVEEYAPPAGPADADALLLDVEPDVRAGRTATEAASREALTGELGWWEMVLDRVRGVPKAEALRRALLDWVKEDKSFELSTRDATFEKVVERVGPGVDFVITGHTHMERAIRIEPGAERYYYNSGTWVRILLLSEELLKDDASFQPVYDALSAGSMAALDAAVAPAAGATRPLLADRATVVHLSAQPEGVVGRLYRAADDPAGEAALLPVAGSEFWRR